MVRLWPSSYRRCSGDPTARLKSTSYAFYRLANRQAVANGADQALLFDTEGAVSETDSGNLMFLRDETVHTPQNNGDFLPGIGRAVLLEALRDAGIAVEEGGYRLEDLQSADALLVTNAVYGPRPACLLDNTPGDISSIQRLWQDRIRQAL